MSESEVIARIKRKAQIVRKLRALGHQPTTVAEVLRFAAELPR